MSFRHLHIALLLLCVSVAAYAQESGQGSAKTSMVYLEHSETLSFDEKRLPDAQILRGNVCFRHDSALMYCDSAYFFDKIIISTTSRNSKSLSIKSIVNKFKNSFSIVIKLTHEFAINHKLYPCLL